MLLSDFVWFQSLSLPQLSGLQLASDVITMKGNCLGLEFLQEQPFPFSLLFTQKNLI